MDIYKKLRIRSFRISSQDLVFSQFLTEGGLLHAQQVGGLFLVSPGEKQHALQNLFFKFLYKLPEGEPADRQVSGYIKLDQILLGRVEAFIEPDGFRESAFRRVGAAGLLRVNTALPKFGSHIESILNGERLFLQSPESVILQNSTKVAVPNKPSPIGQRTNSLKADLKTETGNN